MTKRTLDSINKELNDRNIFNADPHGLMENKSCQTSQISFFDEVICWGAKSVNCIHVIYFDFCIVFEVVLHGNLIKN